MPGRVPPRRTTLVARALAELPGDKSDGSVLTLQGGVPVWGEGSSTDTDTDTPTNAVLSSSGAYVLAESGAYIIHGG